MVWVVIAIAVASVPGCATRQPAGEPLPASSELASDARALALHLTATRTATPSDAESGVRVWLAFAAGADLDLYVTDPTFETVYFANSPNRVGGRLEEDVRCDAPAPRIETITFPATLPGAYRVGVDFPGRCKGGAARVGFAVHIEGQGFDAAREGTVDAGRFLPLVLEVTTPSPIGTAGPPTRDGHAGLPVTGSRGQVMSKNRSKPTHTSDQGALHE